MTRSVKIGAAIGFLVGALGLLGSIMFGPISEGRCSFDTLIDGKEISEGTGIRWEASWWPPGTRCIFSMPDGSVHDFVNVIGLGQWAAIIVIAFLAFGLSQGIAKTYRKMGKDAVGGPRPTSG